MQTDYLEIQKQKAVQMERELQHKEEKKEQVSFTNPLSEEQQEELEDTAADFLAHIGNVFEEEETVEDPPEFAAKKEKELAQYKIDMALMKLEISEKKGKFFAPMDKRYTTKDNYEYETYKKIYGKLSDMDRVGFHEYRQRRMNIAARNNEEFDSKGVDYEFSLLMSGRLYELIKRLDLGAPQDKAVFYCGSLAKTHIDKIPDITHIEQTKCGDLFESWKWYNLRFPPVKWGCGDPNSDQELLWIALSVKYAEQASGKIKAYLGANKRENNIYEKYEKPTLLCRGAELEEYDVDKAGVATMKKREAGDDGQQ